MKTTIFSLLLALSLHGFGQNTECRFDKNVYDEFQKIQKLEKDVKLVKKFYKGNGFLDLKLCKYGDLNFFRASTASLNPISVGTSDRIVFLFEDGETLDSYSNSVYFSNYNGARYLFEGTYSLDAGFSKLKTSVVKAVRLYHGNVYKEYAVKKEQAKELQKASNCF